MDCTVVAVILRRRIDSFWLWALRVLSGLAKPSHAGSVHSGPVSSVLQIPQHMASQGFVR